MAETKCANSELSIVEKIVQHWNKSGQQTGIVRMLVCEAFNKNVTKAELAQSIRIKCYSPNTARWNGIGNQDAKYNQIYCTLHCIDKSIKNGKLQLDPHCYLDRCSKSVKVGERGRKVTDPTRLLENELYLWCRSKWDNDRHVTQSIMLHRAMYIDPGFLGGNGSVGHFPRLLNWFCYGFKLRYKLSKRKISSVGQKLPSNWKERHDNIIARIASYQMPKQRPDGTFCPGADDDHVLNTDHVPIWWECHSMHQWGNKKNHACRNVKTGGKDKDRFTCQLTISKSGRKVRIALTF
jgi:hypothetical protein